ncbi:ArsR/SmtB family transcription factor [Chelativorans salis]|uniref:Metalloregulator ArsR/SmtB family transcription factor n=1 Tax=Chelativorans salis TaxID=2978478 RepID=A0ABT2LNG2_9HYPH|nr:metalloregulator ArsR/SmtB family transcription factor [Chelativorans sp. EGI FJ00035]MCT7376110.1 metalloregulator ArsR/SmtB family transcription factor [Chelativorans sp. EGI FJ00035]
MKAGTDLAQIGSLVGDPARANMLAALMGGTALTASELALEAGVTLPTASAHLAKLGEGGLVSVARQGRHRYYALADHSVAAMLENIMGVAATLGPKRVLPGPRDKAMREARVCYDHLAGEMGVAMLDSFVGRGLIRVDGEQAEMSEAGASYFAGLGIDLDAMGRKRRPMCRTCLDWSVRRSHLAGGLGAAMLERIQAKGWARREKDSRVVRFTPMGRREFEMMLRG